MIRQTFVVLCLCLPLFAGELQTLESLVAQWVDLRRAQTAGAEAWRGEKARISTELELLAQSAARLEGERARLLALTSRDDQTRAVAAEEAQAHRQALADLGPVLDASEKALRARLAALPPPLARRIEEDMDAGASDPGEALRRLRTVFALQEKLSQLQHGLHGGRERVPLAEGAREMDVLWIGTTQAFAVTADDSLAAEGLPGPEGWTWRVLPGEAPRIRRALRLVLGEIPPALLELPLSGGVRP